MSGMKTCAPVRFMVPFMVLAIPLLILLSPPRTALGQSGDRPFSWFVEFVSIDQTTGSLTVRAPFLAHVANYINDFQPGDDVVIVWTQLDRQADAVIYVESADVMDTAGGFVVRAEFVDADLAGQTVTFTVPQAGDAVSALASAQPGTPVRVESPFRQPDNVTPVTSVALNERPAPRPEPVVEEEILANPDGPLAQIAGDWKLEADIMGNALALDCALAQSDTEVSGTCQGPTPEPVPITGSVAGNTVRFTIATSFGGTDIQLGYTGAVAESGILMEGNLNLGGMATSFKGTKQEG